MAFAERLYEADLPPSRYGDELGTSFHEDSLVLRRWDMVEDSWRDFLEVNDASSHTGARAYAAVNYLEYINAQLVESGLNTRVSTNEGILPLMMNGAIGFIAHGELLKHYRKDHAPRGAIKSQRKMYAESKQYLAREVVEYLNLYSPREKYKGAEDIMEAIQYASIVVLGPATRNQQKNILYRTEKEFPLPELQLAFRNWKVSLDPPLRSVK